MYQMPRNCADKVFITAAGYLIPFNKDGEAIKEFCPGTNESNLTAIDRGAWVWTDKGKIFGLSGNWNNDLEIVGEYQGRFPFTGPPEGFTYPSGYPKLQQVNLGEYYFHNGLPIQASHQPLLNAIKIEKIMKLEDGKVYRTKGNWLIKIESAGVYANANPYTSPYIHKMAFIRYWVYRLDGTINGTRGYDDELTIVEEYRGSLNPEFPLPPEGYKWKYDYPKLEVPKRGDSYISIHGLSLTCMSDRNTEHRLTMCRLNTTQELDHIVTPIDIVKTPDYIWNTLNYFLFEPIENAAKVAKGSFRYLLLGGMICFLVMPTKTYDFARSILPKISIKIRDNQ